MNVFLDIVLIVLAVDFASGLFHWLEDRYGNPYWPVTGRWITRPNILHHRNPRAFTRNSWLRSAAVLILFGIILLSVAWMLDLLTWQLALFVGIGVNANEIHKWSHTPRQLRPKWVITLQKLHLIQTPRHHARHHGGGKDTHYCVVTNFINPIADRLRLWRGLEWVIMRSLGVTCRA